MLRALHVRNFVLIEDTTLELSPSAFHAFTGETGAGKSLLVDALTALLGARAQKDWIRHGAKEAVVEATFALDDAPAARALVGELGITVDDDELTVRRVITADGRGKVVIGGSLCSVAELQRVAQTLVAICGQNAQHELTAEGAPLLALDRYGSTLELREEFATQFDAYRALETRRAELVASETQRLQRVDYLNFQLAELEEAAIGVGEEAQLRSERGRLAHGEKLRAGLAAVAHLLSGDDDAAVHRVASARKQLRDLTKIDPALEALASRLDGAAVELDDLARTIDDNAGEVTMDPQALDRVETRLALMAKLSRKHGVAVDALAVRLAELLRERDGLQNADSEKSSLDKQIDAAEQALAKIGRKLSAARKLGADKFSKQVTQALRPLAMPKAEFKARLETTDAVAQASRAGFDRCSFELASNAGEPMRPLGKVASGGELSRVTLALQAVLYDRSEVPTYVFDEVDAGIGGAVAEVVGQTLRRLGERRQVLCVTHLAQIAALSDNHFRVEKKTNGGRTSSHVAELRGAMRKEELARMLGGVEITEAVRRHAEELLGQ